MNVRQTKQGRKRLLQKINFTNKTQFHIFYIFKVVPANTLFIDKASRQKSILESRASTLDVPLSHTTCMPQQQEQLNFLQH